MLPLFNNLESELCQLTHLSGTSQQGDSNAVTGGLPVWELKGLWVAHDVLR